MTLNLAKAVIGYLKDRPEQKFTARQIAEWVFASYPDECQEKRANSRGDYIKSDADLVQQLVAEISSQRPRMQTKHPGLKTTEGRPRRYYFSERSDSAEVAAAESEGTSTTADASILKIDEHALYPLLSQYLWEEFSVLHPAPATACGRFFVAAWHSVATATGVANHKRPPLNLR